MNKKTKRSSRSKKLEIKYSSRPVRAAVKRKLDEACFIVFDIETTGGNPTRNGITEICAIKYKDGEEVDRFYSLVNPQIPIPPIVRKMTGINNKMVKDAPKIDEVMPRFVRFVSSHVLVSHNTIGDMKFLRYYSEQVLGKPIDNFFLCTHLLVEKLIPEAPNKSLKGLAQYLKISADGKLHRASADALVTLGLAKNLFRRLKNKKIDRVDEAIRFQGDYESIIRLGWDVSADDLRNAPNGPGVFILQDRMGKTKFISAAPNLRKDLERLRNYAQLPKKLLRIVINTKKVSWEETTSFLEAALKEARQLARTKINYDPRDWHQRSFSVISLKRSAGGVEKADVGGFQTGCVEAYGPINDHKKAQGLIKELAKLHGSEGKTFKVEAWQRRMLNAFFTGQINFEMQGLNEERQSIINKVLWWRRGEIDLAEEYAAKLAQISLPQNLRSIFSLSGVAVVTTSPIRAYVISQARLIKEMQSSLVIEEFLKRKAKNLIGLLNEQDLAYRLPLDDKTAAVANAVFWWLFSGPKRREGLFIDKSELLKFL